MYWHRLFLILLLFYSCNGLANMADPVRPGTMGKVPFTSEHISIDKENITIIPYGNFSSAQFIVEYYINADEESAAVPLVFYASDFEKDFKVWVDEKLINTQPIPNFLHSSLNKNYRHLAAHFSHPDIEATFINDHSSDQLTTVESDLKYFEIPISIGKHIIRVAYTANYWVDNSFRIREFSFRYALSPAYQWKSYGDLKITLDARNLNEEYQHIYTNLKTPDEGSVNAVAKWHYKEIPVDVMMIQCKEYHPWFIRALVYLNPLFFMLILSGGLIFWHVIKIALNRKTNTKNTISKIALYGSIALPLIVLLTVIFYNELLASLTHSNDGYFFLILFAYPFLMPCYLFIIWLYDWGLQINYSKKKESL
ncbi:MAG: hypothetical protein JWM14_1327 [Chitinophagaceae bacterium]|nr:hypothetical protein [Chitinophagaceae bacterium]